MSPNANPGDTAYIMLPDGWKKADVIEVKAIDNHGNELFTWDFKQKVNNATRVNVNTCKVDSTKDNLIINSEGRTYTFSRLDGLLKGVAVGDRKISFANGIFGGSQWFI